MRSLLIFLSLTVLPFSLCAQSAAGAVPPDFNVYKQLNDREVRLSEYKDNDDALRLKLNQLQVINRSRKKYRAQPVKLDILASRVANSQCREAGENNFVSHWNLAGEKPYHRYAFAGGLDHVTENAYGEWTSGNWDNPDKEIADMMASGHASFMSEKAPNDGHKKNIIDKSHNYVGIGYFISGSQFRYNEEFIDRYLEFENVPSVLKVNEAGTITINRSPADYLYFMVVYRENVPRPMTVSQLKKTGSYKDYTGEEYMKYPGWELAGYRDGNAYHLPLKFSREGLYYIHLYIDKKEILKPSSFSTRGKTEACGIVIRVEK